MLKPGDKVEVFQKPFTHEDFEGVAQVVRIISRRKEGDQIDFRCIVNFPDDGPNTTVERRIFVPINPS